MFKTANYNAVKNYGTKLEGKTTLILDINHPVIFDNRCSSEHYFLVAVILSSDCNHWCLQVKSYQPCMRGKEGRKCGYFIIHGKNIHAACRVE
jgi:hypothetical protein